MMKITLGLVLVVILSSLAFSMQTQPAYAIKTINLNATGGDCQSSSIGTWNAVTNTCTLSQDITGEGIVIGDNNVILDGNGHTISGTSGNGVLVQIKQGVTVKNLKIQNFDTGINVDNSNGVTLSGNTITGSGSRGISVSNSNTLTINGNSVSGIGGDGITFAASQSSISNNIISSNKGNGIYLQSSSTTVSGNTIQNNNIMGIYMVGAASNTITGNTITGNNNGQSYYGGISLVTSSGNTITGNTISNNQNGISVDQQQNNNNVITKNTISSNINNGITAGSGLKIYDNVISKNGYGIIFYPYASGTVYNNNFISNQIQIQTGIGTTFYLNPPVGGNYWSDYSTTAQGCNDGNSNNFCDIPYPFSGGTVGVVDNYPWTIQNGWHTVITTGGNITTTVVGNATSKVVSYTVSAAQDSSPISVNCTPSSGSSFSIGKTIVVCTASTGVKTSFSVTVNQPDTIPPVVNPPPNQQATATSNSGTVVNYPQATATDNVGVTSGPTCTPVSGSVFSIGNTTVTCTASDAAGNVGKATFTVSVQQSQTSSQQQIQTTSGGTLQVGFSTIPINPTTTSQTQLQINFINKNTNVIQPHIDYKVSVMQGGNQVFGIPLTHTAQGAVSIPIQLQSSGVYQVIVSVAGILFQPIPTETATFSISTTGNSQPVDTTPPVVSVPSNLVVTTTSLQGAVVNYPQATATDNVGVTNGPICNPPSGSTFPLGTTTVTCTASDAAGNAGQATFSVTVEQSQTTTTSSTITSSTDKSSYNSGDSIVVSGTVSQINSVNPQLPVTIQTYDMYNVLVRIDQAIPSPSGQFSATIPAHGPAWQNTGTYTLKIQYDQPSSASKLTFYFNSGTIPTPVPVPTQTEIDISVGAGSSTSADCVAAKNCYSPNPAYVSSGTTVTWKNNDKLSHTVTSGHVSDNDAGSLFDSGLVKPGNTFQFTFATAGAYNYFCTVHPWMIGQVIVGSDIQPVPTPQPTTTQTPTNNVQTTPNTGIINPTQQEIANANQAIAAEVNVGTDKTETTSIDNNVSVKTTQNTPDSLGVQVTATNQTGPKVIAFNLEAKSINVQNLKELGVMYDGKLIQPAPNMDAILHAKPTDNPSFAIVVTQSGIQVLVLVPHFSTHSITIMNMSKIMTTTIPEFPFAAIVLIIAVFSIVLIPKIRQIQKL